MGVGESLYHQLLAQREAQRQYQFDFMPTRKVGGPYTAWIDTHVATVHVVASDFGRHGLMLDSLSLTGNASGKDGGQSDHLMRLVEKIVETACPYGPIRCIENDERLTGALLRSDPNAEGCYFEIVVEGGKVADLKHYKILESTGERRRTPVNLGRRDFELMTEGLAAAFDTEEEVN
jgi:hypothetical protein